MQWLLSSCLLVGTVLAAHANSNEPSVSLGCELCNLEYAKLLMQDVQTFETLNGRYKPIFSTYNDKKCKLSDFNEIRELGKGTSASVILMKHTKSGQLVVFKLFNDRRVPSLGIAIEEIILHRLDHPNLAKGFCSFRSGDTVYVGMFYRTSLTFEQLAERGALGEEDLKGYARQLVDVLGYLHGRNIIHNDIKLENVLLIERDGAPPQIQLIDYNLANYVPRGIDLDSGSPLYMSPEKLAGERYTNAADWYALGIMLAELSNGVHPFNDAQDVDDLKIIVKSRPISVTNNPILDDFVQQLCMKDPTLRWCQANNKMPEICNHEFIRL